MASKRRSPNLISRGLKVLIVPKAGTSGLIYDLDVPAEVEKRSKLRDKLRKNLSFFSLVVFSLFLFLYFVKGTNCLAEWKTRFSVKTLRCTYADWLCSENPR